MNKNTHLTFTFRTDENAEVTIHDDGSYTIRERSSGRIKVQTTNPSALLSALVMMIAIFACAAALAWNHVLTTDNDSVILALVLLDFVVFFLFLFMREYRRKKIRQENSQRFPRPQTLQEAKDLHKTLAQMADEQALNRSAVTAALACSVLAVLPPMLMPDLSDPQPCLLLAGFWLVVSLVARNSFQRNPPQQTDLPPDNPQ